MAFALTLRELTLWPRPRLQARFKKKPQALANEPVAVYKEPKPPQIIVATIINVRTIAGKRTMCTNTDPRHNK
eukprot:3008822-Amphidinium_carterae.1